MQHKFNVLPRRSPSAIRQCCIDRICDHRRNLHKLRVCDHGMQLNDDLLDFQAAGLGELHQRLGFTILLLLGLLSGPLLLGELLFEDAHDLDTIGGTTLR